MYVSDAHSTSLTRIYIAKHVSRAYAHVRVIRLYLQVTFSKMRKHASSESFCRIFSSRISSSFSVLHNTINMTLRQQSGIVRWKYTLHVYMHKLCAREIRVTTIHHCTHARIYLTHIFVRVWHANRTYFETLYLASDRYSIHMYMYMYNVELLFNRHVTDIMVIIIILLHFLLSIYLWLHCEFTALVIRIYMYIVYTCTYIVTYTYIPLLYILPTMCTVSASHYRQMWSVH